MRSRTVIVTGATKGMGLASSKRLLELGANAVMVYRSDTQRAQAVEIELGKYKGQMLLLSGRHNQAR